VAVASKDQRTFTERLPEPRVMLSSKAPIAFTIADEPARIVRDHLHECSAIDTRPRSCGVIDATGDSGATFDRRGRERSSLPRVDRGRRVRVLPGLRDDEVNAVIAETLACGESPRLGGGASPRGS
jgi:hypothetical protein